MWDLLICCKLNPLGGLLQETEDWFDEHIPDLDTSSVFDIDKEVDENDDFIYSEGCVAVGDLEFYDESGSEILEEGTLEYQIAYLNNQINSLTYYILLSELEESGLLENLGIVSFDINDGAQFGYNKKLEFARKDLIELKEELSKL